MNLRLMRSKLRAMKIEGPLVKGTFVERPNRFITHIRVNGDVVVSHLLDPGRLKELLVPRAVVWLRPAPENTTRKTQYSTVLVEKKGVLVSLDTTLPNQFLRKEFDSIPAFIGWSQLKSEYKLGNHRIDFLLKDDQGNKVFAEVKSVTYVSNGIAQFPDAVTIRGKRHVELLASLSNKGERTMILFICQRPDANVFQPMWDRDPDFSKALVSAKQANVDIKCLTTNVSLKEMTFCREIPVNLTPPNER